MPVATREMTVSRAERFAARAGEADATLQMDEDAFRVFYERTARPLWAYLSRMTGNAHLADDLHQEAYYRLLRSDRAFDSEAHRRNYLYRIATNLVRDHGRRHRLRAAHQADSDARMEQAAAADRSDRAGMRSDVRRALARLGAREREVLWLAYAEGASHREIAEAVGLKPAGIRVLLFRARRKLARLLHVAPGELAGGANRAQD